MNALIKKETSFKYVPISLRSALIKKTLKNIRPSFEWTAAASGWVVPSLLKSAISAALF